MKTGIDRKIWLIIGIAIMVAALVGLFRIYAQQVKEQEQLITDLATQQSLLQTLTTQENSQQEKLNAAESLLDTSQAKFAESVESIEYGEDLFKIAHDCNVELTSLSPSVPGTRTVGAVTYSVSSFAITVQGAVDDILSFINALRTGSGFQLPWSAEVNSVSIDIGGEGGVASISVDIYGYKG
jgi:hypothetical protein